MKMQYKNNKNAKKANRTQQIKRETKVMKTQNEKQPNPVNENKKGNETHRKRKRDR